jgi:acyl-CoA thioester hydrolase
MALPERPLTCLETRVRPEWVDYNEHMNDAAYGLVFGEAIGGLIDWLGLDAGARAEHGYTMFTLETHIRYLREAHEGQALVVDAALVEHDPKRLHLLLALRDAATHDELATSEYMLMGMDTAAGRPAPFPAPIAAGVERLRRDHGCPEWPAEAGRAIGIRRK